jgi:CRISPR-associated protein Cmr6
VTVDFNWRLRVGGTRGFRELLLPVFHPVFGVPYIPPSSLKGAARAWARKNDDAGEVFRLLGMLQGKEAKAAKVEFLDAFPTKPCLSVDVATPQWSWGDNKVSYKPEPHPLLSMEQPNFLIGLRPTARGTADDVRQVKEWLENALKTGIGSRVSSGYGRALGQASSLPHSQNYNFELWTQGMYGVEPPSKDNGYQGVAEFRPTAVRGILRYWFRAVALGFYDAESCQELEDEIFGNLSKPGKVATGTIVNPSNKTNPFLYEGKICLEAAENKYLNLLEKLLILASHLGGVGRGSRRPLHLLNGRMRGCHWVVNGEGLPLEGDRQNWQQFFDSLRLAFNAVKSPVGSHTSSPGQPDSRQQDVLDKNALVFLLKSPGQVPPERVKNWNAEGETDKVRGTALSLLYGDPKFKGESGPRDNKTGNPNVGGSLGTPSYVWIKSVFPYQKTPYQVVTIFGVDDSDRLEFAQELVRQGAELVYGEMPGNNQPPPASNSRPKPKPKRKR